MTSIPSSKKIAYVSVRGHYLTTNELLQPVPAANSLTVANNLVANSLVILY